MRDVLQQPLTKLAMAVISVAVAFAVYRAGVAVVTVEAAAVGQIGGVRLGKIEYPDSTGYLVIDEGNIKAAIRFSKEREVRLVAVTPSEIAILEKPKNRYANSGEMYIIGRATGAITPLNVEAEYWNTTADNTAVLFTKRIESPPGTSRMALLIGEIWHGDFVTTDTLPLPPHCQNISNASFSPDGRYVGVLCVTTWGGKKKNIAQVYVADRETGAVIAVQSLNGPYTEGEERPFVEKYFKWDSDGTVSAHPPQLEW